MDKEKLAQLIADYRDGKITAEEFSARRGGINGGESPHPERPVMNTPDCPPMPTNTKILIGIGGGILLMLCVIAFLIFWNSPEQVAKRALPGLLKAQEEAEQKVKQEMEAELAAQKYQEEKFEEITAQNEAVAIFMDLGSAFLGAKHFIAKKTKWSPLKEIPTIWDVIEAINELNLMRGTSDFVIRRPDKISINGKISYTSGYLIQIKYDLAGVNRKTKAKLLNFKGKLSDIGFFLANKDGYPFDGRNNAVYCVIKGKS